MAVATTQFWAVMTAAILAAQVEAVEALTIVLAVATVRGWRPAGFEVFLGLVTLGLIVLVLGPLLNRVPLHLLQLAIGIFAVAVRHALAPKSHFAGRRRNSGHLDGSRGVWPRSRMTPNGHFGT